MNNLTNQNGNSNSIINTTYSNVDCKSLIELLQDKEIGDVVTYYEMKKVCLKADDERIFKGSLHKAIDKLRRSGIVYHNVQGIGYKRANSSEIVEKSPKFLKYARRKLTKSQYELKVVDDDKITKEELVKKNTMLATNGLMLYLGKNSQIQALEQQVRVSEVPNFNPKESLKFLHGF